jgi:hypothetical protein
MDFKVLYRKTLNGMSYDSLPSNIIGFSDNCDTYWNPTLYFNISNPPNPSDNISVVLLTSKHNQNNWYYSDVSPINLTDAINNDVYNKNVLNKTPKVKPIPKFSGTTATFGLKYVQNTSPVPIKIPKFIIRTGGSNWAKLIQNGDETATNIQTWNPDKQSNDLDYAKPNQIGVQFRYFAEFWLNKTGKSSGSTNVYGSTVNNNLGKYDFSVNETTYTGTYNNTSWTWDYSGEYCFSKDNAQIPNTCMNGWEYQNGNCYASGNSNGNASTKCSPYSWNGMAAYSDDQYDPKSDMRQWVNGCSVGNSQNCKNILTSMQTIGLLAHYDATKSSSYEVNGSNVTRWEDLSGNGYTLVNYGTGPKVTTIQSNGLSNTAFNFNPDLGMTCSDVPLVKNLTIFMVIKYNTAIKTWGNFMHHGNRDSDWSLESHPDSTTVHFQSNNDNEKNRLKCLNNKNYILIGRITSSLREFWAYSDTEPPQKTSATSVTIEPGNKPIFVGKSNINEACNSVIGEILYFNQSISTEDFNTNLGYLQQKWFNKN